MRVSAETTRATTASRKRKLNANTRYARYWSRRTRAIRMASHQGSTAAVESRRPQPTRKVNREFHNRTDFKAPTAVAWAKGQSSRRNPARRRIEPPPGALRQPQRGARLGTGSDAPRLARWSRSTRVRRRRDAASRMACSFGPSTSCGSTAPIFDVWRLRAL